jgi:hypothetical protein
MPVHDARAAFGGEVPFELLPTNLPGVFTSPAAPPDFDPMAASDAALLGQGILWQRPRPGDDPRLVSAWAQAARRGRRPEARILPYLVPRPGVTHQLRGVRQRDDGSYTSDNWSGVTLAPPAGQSWSGAVGHWAIPAVDRPAGPAGAEGGWNSSSWVGIDGGYGSINLLAAGVEQRLDAAGEAFYVAWYEWFVPPRLNSPAYIWQTDIPNFQLRAGDVVHCSAHYLTRIAGHLIFANDSTGEHMSITLAPPPGATFAGACAAWIMETPDFGQGPGSLPTFTPVRFEGAVACGRGIAPGDPADGDLWMIESFGLTLTSVSVATGSVTISDRGRDHGHGWASSERASA